MGVDRAAGLVNAVWDTAGPVPLQSCVGLRDAIDAQLGVSRRRRMPAEERGNDSRHMGQPAWLYELEEEDFERAKEATARCGPGREVPKAGI